MHPIAARKVALSGLLGLPTALLAHAFVYGPSHAAAGPLHALAVEIGFGFGLLAALFTGLGLLRKTRCALPDGAVTLLSAAAWLATIEAVESPHAIPAVLCLFAIAAATASVSILLHAFEHTVVAVARLFGAHRGAARTVGTHTFSVAAPRCPRTLGQFALFSRPPPALS